MFCKIWNFIKLTRPLFLGGGVILYLMGVFAALAQGFHLNLFLLLAGQIFITATQLMTQYSNEYYDQEGDRINQNRTWFSGGSGILSSGAVSPRAARNAALFLGGLSLAGLLITGWQVPAVLLPGLLAIILAWSYSGPPLSLVGSGWGELSASLVVAFLVPVVGYMLQTGGLVSPLILITCIPLIFIHLAMLVAFQIPDRSADTIAGKRTLLVRLGPAGAMIVHDLSLIIAFCVILYLSLEGWPGAQFAWLALPLAAWQAVRIRRYFDPAPPSYAWMTLGALGLFAITSMLWLAGFAFLWVKT